VIACIVTPHNSAYCNLGALKIDQYTSQAGWGNFYHQESGFPDFQEGLACVQEQTTNSSITTLHMIQIAIGSN
jgi:hypothetical protein